MRKNNGENTIEEYENIIEKLPAAFAQHKVIYDSAGKAFDYIFVKVNKKFEEMTGLKKEDILNKKVTKVLKGIKNSKFKWIEFYGDIAMTGKEKIFEKYSEPLKRWYEVTVYSHKKGYFTTIFYDITEKKQQKEKLNYVLRFSKIGFWEYDIISKSLSWSEECENIFGLEAGEFEGEFGDFLKRVAPEDRAYVQKINSPITEMKQGIPLEYEHRIIKKNGEKRWVRESANLNDENKILGLVIDITEQKTIEKELKISREKLEHLISETTAVIYSYQIIGDNYKILYLNENVKNVIGFKAERFIGNQDFHLSCIHPEDREILKAKIKKMREIDYSIDEYRFRDKNGNYRRLYDQQKVSRRENGVITVVGSWWDITEERQEQNKEINALLFKDNLSGLHNRKFFKKTMADFDLKDNLPSSIIIADINGLKIVNDSYGFEKGDQLLKETAAILANFIRDKDVLARWGGDEFIILVPGSTKEQALNIIKSLKARFAASKKVNIPISISFGVATAEKESADFSDLIHAAEKMMDQNKLLENSSAKSKIVENILSTLGAKSYESKEHALRMSSLAHKLGKRVGLSNYNLNRLSLLARLHDIGKTTISEAILTKPGRLTESEWKIMQEHPRKGFEIASAIEEFSVIAEEILSHHEHWDGNGYPRALKGEEIPFLARIISIIDAYDVITNDRPYTKAQPPEKALAEIKRCAGSQFDPQLARDFLLMMEEN